MDPEFDLIGGGNKPNAGTSFILLKLIGFVIPLRASADDEAVGLDLGNHGEEAYVHGDGGSSKMSHTDAVKVAPALRSELA